MSLRRDERGNVAMIAALMITVFVGTAALGVDGSSLYLAKAELQTASDAAALGAAQLLPNTATAASRAVQLANQNVPAAAGTVVSTGDVVFGTYDTTNKAFVVSNTNINAVQVTARRTAATGNPAPSFFGGVFGKSSYDVAAKSVAVMVGPSACLIALSPNGTGFSVSGGGKVSVPNCGVQVNSSSATAATTGSNSSALAKAFCVVGGVSGSGFSPAPQTNCPTMADPLSSIPEPTTAGCNIKDYSGNKNATIYPATYCGKFNISGSGITTFSPGIYYFKGATLKITQSAILSGTGVMIFLDSTSTMSFASSGDINLSAPTSGSYAGLLIFQSRGAKSSIANSIAGGVNMHLNGTIYTPTTSLQMNGNGSLSDTADTGYVIANVFSYSGSPTFTFSAVGGVPSALAGGTALVQ